MSDPVRDRATAILTLAEAATEGPWWIEESAETWVLQGVAFRLAGGEDWPEQVVNKQILKAPKTGTPYAEYWPDGTDACFIAASRSETPWLGRRLLEALDTIDKAKRLHRRDRDVCDGCEKSWPCPTWQALNPKEKTDGNDC